MFEVVRYSEQWEKKWDSFIEQESINGSFLQSRRFLGYHPVDRFSDHSLILKEEGKDIIAAVIPGCEKEGVYYSHQGSTFGGIVIGKRYYSSKNLESIILQTEKYLKEHQFIEVFYKIPSDLFSLESSELLQYFLNKNFYTEWMELSTYINILAINDPIMFVTIKQRSIIRKAIKLGMTFRKVQSEGDIRCFYELLESNLLKFKRKPVHSFEELLDLSNNRLKEDVSFFVVEYQSRIIAGAMTFGFKKTLHTQYLASSQDFNTLGAMPFLYYSLMLYAIEQNFQFLSWGISTTERGKVLNEGLIQFKESFNSSFINNRTFWKKL